MSVDRRVLLFLISFFFSTMMINKCHAFGRIVVTHNLLSKKIRFPSGMISSSERTSSSFVHRAVPPENNNNAYKYVPYQDPYDQQQPQRRRSSSYSNNNWEVPESVSIPEDKLDITFVRASGSGGQNVNKVNTKVNIRFHVMDAYWIGPYEVRERLTSRNRNRINKEGYLNIISQEHRTQTQNRKTALSKIKELILEAYPRPKVRNLRTGISKSGKKRNTENKRRKSETKANRRRVDY